jgi:hypothetical protein
MKLLILIGDDVHTEALRRARELGTRVALPAHVLNAPLDDETHTWIERIWDTIEGALRCAYRQGMDAARPLIQKASDALSELGGNVAKRAEEIRAVITERLNSYLHTAIDGALQRVRSTISVGNRELKITAITVEQRINLSGSLKASLEEICEFVAEGEISLSAQYGVKE